MLDRLKEILAKIKAWWDRFTTKQKTVIIAISAAVIFTFFIIVYVLSRPQYVELGTYASSQESAEVVEILKEA